MTSTRNRHGLAQKWKRGDRFYAVCQCGKLFKRHSAADARDAVKDHRTEATS